MSESNVTRRDMLGRGSALAIGLLLGGSALRAEEITPGRPELAQNDPPATPVTVAVIGANDRGREILTSLTYVPGAVVKYVCDTYDSPGFQKRALENAPKATFVTDYKSVLADPAVQGVFIATPTHQHKQIALDAIAAGKHVYCETPLAHTVEDAKAIAQAGAAAKTIFQSGMQNRTNPQHHHVQHFVDTGAVGNVARCAAEWNQKSSWRRAAPTGDRESALNWRLDKSLSTGVMGEIGIHQVDVASWYLKMPPVAVSGFGSGGDVARNVTCIFEYPNGVRLTYDATLGNSFGGTYELFQGDQSAVLLRGARAWMFKESDATALGWEVYAKKDQVGDDQGIMLVANASKILAQNLSPADFARPKPEETPLTYACTAFVKGIRTGKQDQATLDAQRKAAEDAGEAWKSADPTPNDSSAQVGYAATVIAILANNAVKTGARIAINKEMFTL